LRRLREDARSPSLGGSRRLRAAIVLLLGVGELGVLGVSMRVDVTRVCVLRCAALIDRVGVAASPTVLAVRRCRASPVRNLEALYGKTVANFDETARIAVAEGGVSTFGQPLERYKTDAVVFVGQVGPDYVVEDVGLDRIYGKGKCCEAFRSGCVMESCCIYCEAGKVIEMWVGDEVGADVLSDNMDGVCSGRSKGKCQARKGPGFQSCDWSLEDRLGSFRLVTVLALVLWTLL